MVEAGTIEVPEIRVYFIVQDCRCHSMSARSINPTSSSQEALWTCQSQPAVSLESDQDREQRKTKMSVTPCTTPQTLELSCTHQAWPSLRGMKSRQAWHSPINQLQISNCPLAWQRLGLGSSVTNHRIKTAKRNGPLWVLG